jgi:hypothetical protein
VLTRGAEPLRCELTQVARPTRQRLGALVDVDRPPGSSTQVERCEVDIPFRENEPGLDAQRAGEWREVVGRPHEAVQKHDARRYLRLLVLALADRRNVLAPWHGLQHSHGMIRAARILLSSERG